MSITFPTKNPKGDCPAVVSGTGARGLIVLHEWWGMNKQIRQQAADIAAESGLKTLVPDLYRGQATDDREEAGHLMGGLDFKMAVEDVQAAALYLKSVGCDKVAVTGFCMGGALSFAAAVLAPDVCAAVPFYGIPSEEIVDLTKIKIPTQAHHAKLDDIIGFSSDADYAALKKKLKGNDYIEFHSYDANHAFCNTKSPNYNKLAAELASQRMYEFLKVKMV